MKLDKVFRTIGIAAAAVLLFLFVQGCSSKPSKLEDARTKVDTAIDLVSSMEHIYIDSIEEGYTGKDMALYEMSKVIDELSDVLYDIQSDLREK